MSHPVADYISVQFRALWHHPEEENRRAENKSLIEGYEGKTKGPSQTFHGMV